MFRVILALWVLAGLATPGWAQVRFPEQPDKQYTDADLADLPATVERLSLRGRRGYGSDDITDAGIRHLAGKTRLRVLHAGGFELTDAALESIGTLESLEELHLDSNRITGRGLEHLLGLKKLRRLNLDFNPLDPQSFATIARLSALTHLYADTRGPVDDFVLEQCGRLTNLVELRLSEKTEAVTDQGVSHLAGLKKLTNLQLVSTKHVTDAGLAPLAALTELRVLSLGDLPSITPRGLDFLRHLGELRRLALGGVPVDDQNIHAIARLTKLEHLMLWNLNGAGVSLDSLGELAALREIRTNQPVSSKTIRILATLDRLEVIRDELTEITDEDLAHLARLPRLHTLILDSPQITAASLPTLAGMKSLRELFVTDRVQITPAQWTALGRESLPACRITRYYPPYTVYYEAK